jgi:hypothetical protein
MRILADLTKLLLGAVLAAGLAGGAAAASLLSLPTRPPVLTGSQATIDFDPAFGVLIVSGPLTALDLGAGPLAITATLDMDGLVDPATATISDVNLFINGVGAGGYDPTQDFLVGLSTAVEPGADYLALLFGDLDGQGQPAFGSRALVVLSNLALSVDQNGVVTGTGDLVVSALSVIPLPATAPLLLGALGAAALVRRRRAAA